MRAIVESLAFLGLSEDEVLQPDAAVAQIEEIAAILQTLTPEERHEFGEFVLGMATAETIEEHPNERSMFLSSLMENLGL